MVNVDVVSTRTLTSVDQSIDFATYPKSNFLFLVNFQSMLFQSLDEISLAVCAFLSIFSFEVYLSASRSQSVESMAMPFILNLQSNRNPSNRISGFLFPQTPVKGGASHPVTIHPTGVSPLLQWADTKIREFTGARPKCNKRRFATSCQHEELISGSCSQCGKAAGLSSLLP